MKRLFVPALLAALLAAVPAQARLVKEMQVTRSGTLAVGDEGEVKAYWLMLSPNKFVSLGDREFFAPATRAALDQAVERKLTVNVAGQMLIFNDRSPVFTLPVARIEVKGLEMDATPAVQPGQQAAQGESPAAQAADAPFKDAALKGFATPALGKALDAYAFFSSREWKVLGGGKAEFRGEIDLSSITEQDSRYVSRLRSRELKDTFRSLAFVAVVTLRPDGTAECPDPSVEAVFEDGVKDRLVWKDPPNYYWERIYRNRKIKLDYFLSKAALNPKYGKGMSESGQ